MKGQLPSTPSASPRPLAAPPLCFFQLCFHCSFTPEWLKWSVPKSCAGCRRTAAPRMAPLRLHQHCSPRRRRSPRFPSPLRSTTSCPPPSQTVCRPADFHGHLHMRTGGLCQGVPIALTCPVFWSLSKRLLPQSFVSVRLVCDGCCLLGLTAAAALLLSESRRRPSECTRDRPSRCWCCRRFDRHRRAYRCCRPSCRAAGMLSNDRDGTARRGVEDSESVCNVHAIAPLNTQ